MIEQHNQSSSTVPEEIRQLWKTKLPDTGYDVFCLGSLELFGEPVINIPGNLYVRKNFSHTIPDEVEPENAVTNGHSLSIEGDCYVGGSIWCGDLYVSGACYASSIECADFEVPFDNITIRKFVGCGDLVAGNLNVKGNIKSNELCVYGHCKVQGNIASNYIHVYGDLSAGKINFGSKISVDGQLKTKCFNAQYV